MGYSYTPGGGARDTVRLLIRDTNQTGADPEKFVFSDEELDDLLALEGDDLRYAAAQALDTIASNQALTFKYVRTLDLTVDGTKVAAELRARAKELRAQSADREPAFAVAEMVVDDFGYREHLWHIAEREGA